MKKLLLLLSLLLTISSNAQIPKGSTKIIITNNLTAKENYDISARTLLQNDYFVDSKDNDLFYIKTQAKPIGK